MSETRFLEVAPVASSESKGNEIAAAKDFNQIPPDHGNRAKTQLIKSMPLIITGATFLVSFGAQIWQSHLRSEAAKRTEWRTALRLVSSKDNEKATIGAYEMESFIDDPEYDSRSRAIALSLLPRIQDHIAFDIILFDLLEGANEKNQHQIIAIDSSLAQQLQDARSRALEKIGRLATPPTDTSLANYLRHPEQFYDEESQSDDLAFALDKTWELDSVTDALSRLWSTPAHNGRGIPIGDQGLVDLVLLNHDFSSVDFIHARELVNLRFFGECQVDNSLLPAKLVEVSCSPAGTASTTPQ